MVMASRAKNRPTHHTCTTQLAPAVSCLVGCATANQLVSLGIVPVLLGYLAGSCSELTAQIFRVYVLNAPSLSWDFPVGSRAMSGCQPATTATISGWRCNCWQRRRGKWQ